MGHRSIVGGAIVVVILSACSSSSDETPSGASGGGGSATGGSSGGPGGSSGGAGGTATAGGGGSTAGTGGKDGGGATGGGTPTGDANGGTAPPVVGSCNMFPAGDPWNTVIENEPADATWTQRLMTLVGGVKIHPDYGGAGAYGIPINVVPASQPKVAVVFDGYPDESDPSPYPFPDPSVVKIEGGSPNACDGDCHLLTIRQGECILYEGYACQYTTGWHCSNGAVWDLNKISYGQRPKGWTSTDAAGLPVAPGVVRWDEVQGGEVRHAIRFTTHCTRPNYVAPATHLAVPGSCDRSDPNSPPMGLRVRLKADYDYSSLAPNARVILRAMQKYGMILADNGSDFYFQGEATPDWPDDAITPLKNVPASAFEVVAPPPLEP